MTPRRGRQRPGFSDREWLDALADAVADAGRLAEESLQRYLADWKSRAAGRDALNRISRAVDHLDTGTRRALRGFQASELNRLRNMAVYEYPSGIDELVHRTLRRNITAWRRALDGLELSSPDGGPPTRTCGAHMPRVNKRCVLTLGHRGAHRSKR